MFSLSAAQTVVTFLEIADEPATGDATFRPGIGARLSQAAGRLVPGFVRNWSERRAEARHLNLAVARLAELSPHLLSDIGLTDDGRAIQSVEVMEPILEVGVAHRAADRRARSV